MEKEGNSENCIFLGQHLYFQVLLPLWPLLIQELIGVNGVNSLWLFAL